MSEVKQRGVARAEIEGGMSAIRFRGVYQRNKS
jgi:hypothetical protein